MSFLKVVKSYKCFGGEVIYGTHDSAETGTPMRLSVFVPPKEKAKGGMYPVVYWLSGLTCTEDNFTVKAGAYRAAAELGLAIVAPDTSPRGAGVPGESDKWDFGLGAGFYVDATQVPWSKNYRMDSYVTKELPRIVRQAFPVLGYGEAIMGHSMGGHGALVLGLRNGERFCSISAFSPICAPSQVPWGQKAFQGYLGSDRKKWQEYDASCLVAGAKRRVPILVDQGAKDDFLSEQLCPEKLEEACRVAGYPLTLRMQDGYDHSYFFIATFIEDHLRFHAEHLGLKYNDRIGQ